MTSHTSRERQFTSDNASGICPEAWAAMERANHGHAPGYGDDPWTQRAADLLREVFETDCDIYFAFNGTAANSMALASLCQAYHSVICHEGAHVETDECGAPEFFSGGSKILTATGAHGKIDPAEVGRIATRRKDIHYPRPQALSLTQATEVGTVYSPAELDALGEQAKRFNLNVHMDGARFANAVASLGLPPAELTWRRGVDVLCLGGTKNGMAVGEAVVFFDRKLAREFDLRCKQSGQLASKMRFLAAPWVGMLEDGAWLRRAGHANIMAARLEGRLKAIPGVELPHPRQANAVFVKIPKPAVKSMFERGWKFYDFFHGGLCRLMCSWDTTEADVDALAGDLGAVMRGNGGQR